LVGQDTLQVGPLAQSADWQRGVIVPGEWHPYALSWDAHELCLFVDGGVLARQTRSSPSGMTAPFPRVYVGARSDGTYLADSQIAHLVLLNKRLTHPDMPRLPSARVCTIAIIAGTVAPSTDLVLHLANVPLAAKVTISRKGASNVWPQVFMDCGGDTFCSGALLPVTAQPSLAFVPPQADSGG